MTNSHYQFVDKGMEYLLGGNDTEPIFSIPGNVVTNNNTKSHWTNLFDVVITSSAKPSFYTRLNFYNLF